MVERARDERSVRGISALAVLAWARFRLTQYEEALRLWIEITAQVPERIHYRFNLAASALAAGRVLLAEQEYQRALKAAELPNQPGLQLRRRGLLHVALIDLLQLADPALRNVEQHARAAGVLSGGLRSTDCPRASDLEATPVFQKLVRSFNSELAEIWASGVRPNAIRAERYRVGLTR